MKMRMLNFEPSGAMAVTTAVGNKTFSFDINFVALDKMGVTSSDVMLVWLFMCDVVDGVVGLELADDMCSNVWCRSPHRRQLIGHRQLSTECLKFKQFMQQRNFSACFLRSEQFMPKKIGHWRRIWYSGHKLHFGGGVVLFDEWFCWLG